MPFSYILCLNHPKSFPFQNKAPQNKQSKSGLKSKRGVPPGHHEHGSFNLHLSGFLPTGPETRPQEHGQRCAVCQLTLRCPRPRSRPPPTPLPSTPAHPPPATRSHPRATGRQARSGGLCRQDLRTSRPGPKATAALSGHEPHGRGWAHPSSPTCRSLDATLEPHPKGTVLTGERPAGSR